MAENGSHSLRSASLKFSPDAASRVIQRVANWKIMVGTGGIEPPTS